MRNWRRGRRRGVYVLAGAVVLGLVAGSWATRPTPRDVVRLASVLSMQQRLALKDTHAQA